MTSTKCNPVINKRRYDKDTYDIILEKNRLWKINNPDRIKIIGKKYRTKNKEKIKQWRKNYFELYPDKEREHAKKVREKVRSEVFDIIGRKCVICGFSDIRALQFDHINGDGYKDNKIKNMSQRIRFYRDNPEITKKILQPLCANCNQIKRHIKGENWRHHRN